MDDSPPESPPGAEATWTCGPDCRYAEAVRGEPDWIWCSRPGADIRLCPTTHECRWFRVRPGEAKPEGGDAAGNLPAR